MKKRESQASRDWNRANEAFDPGASSLDNADRIVVLMNETRAEAYEDAAKYLAKRPGNSAEIAGLLRKARKARGAR